MRVFCVDATDDFGPVFFTSLAAARENARTETASRGGSYKAQVRCADFPDHPTPDDVVNALNGGYPLPSKLLETYVNGMKVDDPYDPYGRNAKKKGG